VNRPSARFPLLCAAVGGTVGRVFLLARGTRFSSFYNSSGRLGYKWGAVEESVMGSKRPHPQPGGDRATHSFTPFYQRDGDMDRVSF